MGPEWYEQRYLGYLERLETALRNRRPTRSQCEQLFEDYLGVSEAPAPDSRLRQYFHTPEVLRDLAETLHVPFSRALRETIDRVAPRDPGRYRLTSYRVRELGPLGRYPNVELISGRARFLIHHGAPYLLTLNSPREDDKWSFGSELSDWTRHETRLATAISCTEWGGFAAYIARGSETFTVDQVAPVAQADRVSFMLEHMSLATYARSADPISRQRHGEQDTRRFEFHDFRPHSNAARAFARGFLITHPLLLRTARHYVKSCMLWRTDGLEEDALANLLFALEGCLLLFQDIEGARTDRLDRNLLRRVLARTFVQGDSMYDYIGEAIRWGGMRAELVHPHLAFTGGWTPFLMADDYYEYHRLVQALLTYLVTGTTHEEYELARPATE